MAEFYEIDICLNTLKENMVDQQKIYEQVYKFIKTIMQEQNESNKFTPWPLIQDGKHHLKEFTQIQIIYPLQDGPEEGTRFEPFMIPSKNFIITEQIRKNIGCFLFKEIDERLKDFIKNDEICRNAFEEDQVLYSYTNGYYSEHDDDYDQKFKQTDDNGDNYSDDGDNYNSDHDNNSNRDNDSDYESGDGDWIYKLQMEQFGYIKYDDAHYIYAHKD